MSKKLIILEDSTGFNPKDSSTYPDAISCSKIKFFEKGLGFSYSMNSSTGESVLSRICKETKNCFHLPIYGIYSKNTTSLTVFYNPTDKQLMDIGIVGYFLLSKDFLKTNFDFQRVGKKMSPEREDEIKRFLENQLENLMFFNEGKSYIVVREEEGSIQNESPSLFGNSQEDIFREAESFLLDSDELLNEFELECDISDLPLVFTQVEAQ